MRVARCKDGGPADDRSRLSARLLDLQARLEPAVACGGDGQPVDDLVLRVSSADTLWPNDSGRVT